MQPTDNEYYKRMAVFAYYDKNGIVDDYAIFLLKAIGEHCKNITVVVNGFTTPDSERRLKLNCTQIIYRDNIGFDFGAYKQAIAETSNIEQYDEILFFNQTILGPVYSLNTIFSSMSAKKKADFWSIIRNIPDNSESDDQSAAEFLDNSFFVVRRNMFKSPDFKEYWESLEFTENSDYEPKKQSSNFTKFFTEKGFHFTTYLNVERFEACTTNVIVDNPIELLNLGFPFFKRNALLTAHNNDNVGASAKKSRELYDFVRTNTDYPVSFINKNLLRTLSPATIFKCLALYENVSNASGQSGRTAAVMWFATKQHGELLCNNAVKMQKDVSLLCLFASESLKDKFLPKLPPKTQAIVTDENGFLHLFGKLWKDISVFENILYCHNNLKPESNMLHTEYMLENALDSLNPGKCGAMLANRSDYGAFVALPLFDSQNLQAGINWQQAKKRLAPLVKSVNIEVPLNTSNEGLAIYGSMFFAKVSTVESLSKLEFNDSLFENINPDCDYLIPLAVQSSGHHTVISCNEQQTFDAFINSSAFLHKIILNCSTEKELDNVVVLEKIIDALDFYNKNYISIQKTTAHGKQGTLRQKFDGYIKKITKK